MNTELVNSVPKTACTYSFLVTLMLMIGLIPLASPNQFRKLQSGIGVAVTTANASGSSTANCIANLGGGKIIAKTAKHRSLTT